MRALVFRQDFHPVHTLRKWHIHSALPPFRLHAHDELIEIHYLAAGVQTYEVAGKTFLLHGGDALIVAPTVWHGTGIYPRNQAQIYLLTLWLTATAPMPGWGFSGDEWIELRDAFCRRPALLVRCGDTLRQLWEPLLKDSGPGSFSGAHMRVALLQSLFHLWECLAAPTRSTIPHSVQTAMDFIEQHLDEKIRLDQLARACGVSLPTLKRLFPRYVGLTPQAYIRLRRIKRARELLLRTSSPITDIAFELGFATSQHFSRVFRQLTGMTPRQYRSRPGGRDILS